MAKLWGGRFQKNTDKKVDDFNSSIRFDQRMYRQDITGSIAHATMLGNQGIIPKEDSQLIVKGLKEILADIDKAIKIIRKTEKDKDVIPNLMKGFKIDEIQAEYIAEIKKALADKVYQPQKKSVDTTVCSSSTVVEINGPRIIGERINPTGKKRFKQALLEGDIDYILGQAIEQIHAGADILDVNVGLPGQFIMDHLKGAWQIPIIVIHEQHPFTPCDIQRCIPAQASTAIVN